ncbi:MAG: hypothetical protein DLM55_05475 [Acidimicrobiales bacterium]|nr:MAG: hypothetical protein DLM55_05475 [Acidimicrobiales bacterium]
MGTFVFLVAATLIGTHVVHAATPEPAASAFVGFRLVKQAPSALSSPEITLPQGYQFVENDDKFQYQVASRAEYYSYITGPRSDARAHI